MENYERKNRIAEALSIRGMKQVDLVERAGVSKSALNHWIKQKWQPKQKSLFKMARVLEVSEMWLAGYDTPMERPAEQVNMDKLAQVIHVVRKDDRLINLITNISKLNSDQLTTIESMVNELIKINSQR